MTVAKKVVRFGVFSVPSIHVDEGSYKTAAPHKPLLMSILDMDSYKLRNNLAFDQDFSKNSKQLQEAVYKGFYQTTYVSEVEVSPANPNQRLVVMVDGRVFGNYGQVKVSQVISKDNKKLLLNIKTFIPQSDT